MTTYELVVAKGGPKLEPSTANDTASGDTPPSKIVLDSDHLPVIPPGTRPVTTTTSMGGGTSLLTNKLSIEKLAGLLSLELETAVLDKTGLMGEYSFRLHYLPTRVTGERSASKQGGSSAVAPAASMDSGPTVFEALQSQLGLRLNQRKGFVDVLVVDKAERVPTEN